MGEPAIIQASSNDAAQDATANRAIRDVASTPSPQHIIPAGIVAFLYEHVDFMRAELFGGQVPPVVLSFEVTDRRTLGHYHLMRTGLGVRWALNLNPVHLARPVFEVLSTPARARPRLAARARAAPQVRPSLTTDERHDLACAWTPSRQLRGRVGPSASRRCEQRGRPRRAALRRPSVPPPTRGIAFPPSLRCRAPARPTCQPAGGVGAAGARRCRRSCRAPGQAEGVEDEEVDVLRAASTCRVAIAAFDATCNKCGGPFRLVG